MNIGPISAASLYSTASDATKPQATAGGGGGGEFGQVVKNFAEILQNGETTARAAMSGNADMPTLVEALAKSELAVQTAVTIRGKVVSAYQEILRMPI